MSNQLKNKVIELIQSGLVPKTELDDALNKIAHLESMLEKAKSAREKEQSEYEEQKLAIDIIKAEKETLQAEKETLLADSKSLETRLRTERETFTSFKRASDAKLNEITLKLKQKTHQYDSLLKSKEDDVKKTANKDCRLSIGTQTIKEEPQEIGVVNFPASKAGIKRENECRTPRTKAKRKKVEKSDSSKTDTNTIKSEVTFTCESCLKSWGWHIRSNFQGDPDECDAPDPKRKIRTFPTLDAYKNHIYEDHGVSNYVLKAHHNQGRKVVCQSCAASFECHHHLERHIVIEHANVVNSKMSNKEFFDLYQKYEKFIDYAITECKCDL